METLGSDPEHAGLVLGAGEYHSQLRRSAYTAPLTICGGWVSVCGMKG